MQTSNPIHAEILFDPNAIVGFCIYEIDFSHPTETLIRSHINGGHFDGESEYGFIPFGPEMPIRGITYRQFLNSLFSYYCRYYPIGTLISGHVTTANGIAIQLNNIALSYAYGCDIFYINSPAYAHSKALYG
jgi:hypothetical protein